MRQAGLFRLARRHTRRGLRILCYHSISLSDEHCFRPGVFMSAARFRARMELLRDLRVPVISLDEATSGGYPDSAVVLTFDDGWSGTLQAAHILQEFRYPSTLYVTTYYAQKQTQVFNMLAAYVLWKARSGRLDLPRWRMTGTIDDPALLERLQALGERLPASLRQELADDLSSAAGVDTRGLFRLMNAEEIRAAAAMGMDIQLHTHRHRFHLSDGAANAKEIRDNREILRPSAQTPLRHFCYPSGNYSPAQFSILSDSGIATATTVRPGINFADSHPYDLARYLDSETAAAIEIEAIICGVIDLMKRPRLALEPRRSFRLS